MKEHELKFIISHYLTPTKPNHTHELKQFGKCPSCNETVNIQANKGFCGNCGKRLEWK